MFEITDKNKPRYIRIFIPSLFAVVTSFILTWILLPQSNFTSLFLYYLFAISIAAAIGGLTSGILTTGLILLTIDVFSLPPFHGLQTQSYLLIYLCIQLLVFGSLISLLQEKLTHTKKASDFKRREQEYSQQITKLKEENAKYLDEIKARDEFLSIASHELKTPLTSMLLQLQTALNNIRNVSLANFSVENLLKMLQNAETQTVRLSKMINDLLNVSLITTGRIDLEPEEVNLADLTKNVIDQIMTKDGKNKAVIDLKVKTKAIGMWDKLRIEQVISNLLTNAIKYGDGKPIDVLIDKRDALVRLSVTDQGIGIAPEVQNKIFSKFERAVSNREYKGLGVGLYITSQIVLAHKGSIYVKSKLTHGSTFIIELPGEKA